MAKRDNLQIKYPLDEPVEEKPAIVIPEPSKYNKGISNTIQVRSMFDAKYITVGVVSGREYVFNGAGAVVEVDKLDVDEILSKRKRAGCCGSPLPTSLFEIV